MPHALRPSSSPVPVLLPSLTPALLTRPLALPFASPSSLTRELCPQRTVRSTRACLQEAVWAPLAPWSLPEQWVPGGFAEPGRKDRGRALVTESGLQQRRTASGCAEIQLVPFPGSIGSPSMAAPPPAPLQPQWGFSAHLPPNHTVSAFFFFLSYYSIPHLHSLIHQFCQWAFKSAYNLNKSLNPFAHGCRGRHLPDYILELASHGRNVIRVRNS